MLGTAISTAIVGIAMWFVLPLCGIELPLLECLVFGALIPPTDPVAVTAMLKSVGTQPDIEAVIAGESLFNDGVGIVLFTLTAGLAYGHASPAPVDVGLLLLRQAGGGLLFGFALGWGLLRLLRTVDGFQVEALMMVATVFVGYTAATWLGVSGPLAMVVVGLMVGDPGLEESLSE